MYGYTCLCRRRIELSRDHTRAIILQVFLWKRRISEGEGARASPLKGEGRESPPPGGGVPPPPTYARCVMVRADDAHFRAQNPLCRKWEKFFATICAGNDVRGVRRFLRCALRRNRRGGHDTTGVRVQSADRFINSKSLPSCRRPLLQSLQEPPAEAYPSR